MGLQVEFSLDFHGISDGTNGPLETNSKWETPENGWLEDDRFLLGLVAYFQGAFAVSFKGV